MVIDFERHAKCDRLLHHFRNEPAQPLHLFFRRLQNELVMHLQQKARLQPLFLQSGVQIDHRRF